MQANVGVTQIGWFLKAGNGDTVLKDLAHPGRIAWPTDSEELLRRVEDVRQPLHNQRGHECRDFLDLSVISTFLIRGEPLKTGSPEWWEDHFGGGRSLSGISWERWLSARWASVPVPVAYHDAGSPPARLIYFMVGHGDFGTQHSPYPAWAAEVLGPDSLGVIADAFDAARTLSSPAGAWVAFPLNPPGWGAVSGRSLGLPLALAALSTGTGQPFSRHLVATGDLEPNGKVLRVGEGQKALSSKAACAGKLGYRLFVFPTDNLPGPPLADHVQGRAVADLKTAWIWARYFGRERTEDVCRFEIAPRSAQDFINNCGSLRPEHLRACIQEHSEDIDRLFNEFCRERKNRTQVNKLVQELELSLRGETADLERARLLGGLIHEDLLDQEAITPLAAFSWCSLNVSLANHFGETEAAEHWDLLARKYEEPARRADERQFIRFVNRQFIRERHNTYTFDTSLPGRFQELLDRERASRRQPGVVNYVLGGLCGTVAQNYAFCGPEYLEQTLSHIQEAQDAFGAGTVEEGKEDWIRQFNYLCHALLDAGRLVDARKSLFDYLQWSESSIPEPKSDENGKTAAIAAYLRGSLTNSALQDLSRENHFQIASAARYLWECCGSGLLEKGRSDSNSCVHELLDHLPREYPAQHPWQLFTFNMGRVAHHLGDHDLTCSLWETSVGLCRGPGETAAVMALMPIAQLDKVLGGDLPENLLQEAQGVLEILHRSRYLNREHFKILLKEPDLRAALAAVRENMSTLFPFTYR